MHNRIAAKAKTLAFRRSNLEIGRPADFVGRYCIEYAIALLSAHDKRGHIGPTIEVGFGDESDGNIVVHAIVHTLGEEDSTGTFSRGYLQELCVQWRDAERNATGRSSSDISYWIESFRDTEDLRDRFFELSLPPIDQYHVSRARAAILASNLV